MAQSPCIGLYKPCTNPPFGDRAMYFDHRVAPSFHPFSACKRSSLRAARSDRVSAGWRQPAQGSRGVENQTLKVWNWAKPNNQQPTTSCYLLLSDPIWFFRSVLSITSYSSYEVQFDFATGVPSGAESFLVLWALVNISSSILCWLPQIYQMSY